jgi:hypothetical protein
LAASSWNEPEGLWTDACTATPRSLDGSLLGSGTGVQGVWANDAMALGMAAKGDACG